jgi:hypothetical protein
MGIFGHGRATATATDIHALGTRHGWALLGTGYMCFSVGSRCDIGNKKDAHALLSVVYSN